MTKQKAIGYLKRSYNAYHCRLQEWIKRGWGYKNVTFEEWIQQKTREFHVVFSAWANTKYSDRYFLFTERNWGPMGGCMAKSLYPGALRSAMAKGNLKDWTFHGWQFNRYNNNPNRALAYVTFTPPIDIAEGTDKSPVIKYEPLDYTRAYTHHGLANCGFNSVVLSDDPKVPLGRNDGLESYYTVKLPVFHQKRQTLKGIYADLMYFKESSARVTALDLILHPRKLRWLKRIRENRHIRIVNPAHLSRKTGHACMRVLIGNQTWKTKEQIDAIGRQKGYKVGGNNE